MEDVKPSYLEQARQVTLESRQEEYGHPLVNFMRIAIRWSLWKNIFISPYDVAIMMMDTKIAREQHAHKDDNLVDAIGYASCIDRMDEYMHRLGYYRGITTFIHDTWDVQRMIDLLEKCQSDSFSYLAQETFPDPPLKKDYVKDIPF